MPDLDARIREELKIDYTHPVDIAIGYAERTSAIRAVLKEHRPEWNRTRYYCTCDSPYPCSTVAAIARELGVSE